MKIIYCLFYMSLFLLIGCTSSDDKNIIGTWQELNNPKGRLEFRKDHTGLAFWPGDTGSQESSEMRWVILKKENMVSVITPPGPVNFTIKSNNLIAPNGVVLTKIK